MRSFARLHDAIFHTTQFFEHPHARIFIEQRQSKEYWDINLLIETITINSMMGITSTCKNSFINYLIYPGSILIKCILGNSSKQTDIKIIRNRTVFSFLVIYIY